MGVRRYVPMDELWAMPVPVPVSLLLQDDTLAWSSGQLALDRASAVLHADDLVAQTRLVCDYLERIGERAGLEPSAVRRLLVYYVPTSDDAVAAMLAEFQTRFGSNVIVDPVEVPHFYYPGIVLECDAFFDDGPVQLLDSDSISVRAGNELIWASIESTDVQSALAELDGALTALGAGDASCLSEHWFASADDIDSVSTALAAAGRGSGGHIVSTGASTRPPRGVLVLSRAPLELDETTESHGTVLTVRQSGANTWAHARSTDPTLGLVEQTERAMGAIAAALPELGLTFLDTAKCTAHYLGDSAEELHGNLAVRNRHYDGSGLASTGLPVTGCADERTRISVDLTFRR